MLNDSVNVIVKGFVQTMESQFQRLSSTFSSTNIQRVIVAIMQLFLVATRWQYIATTVMKKPT